MFFIGIFGIERKEKELKSFSAVCPECAKFCRARLIFSYTYFHIFFIPTFRWDKKYALVLNCCGCVYDVPQNYADELLGSETVDFTRLKRKPREYGVPPVCPGCGRILERGFAYCPYCGTTLK